ncbi:MAG TPA: SsrA-binding protein SmpB [Opitutaceae bacterium]|jgi:SsrA-binding protein|nr:SsrA-binding protein SmpB [Opitutaceae bacterium]
MAAKKKDEARVTEARNSKAFRDYTVGDRYEAGVQLKGTEVKSIRAGKAQISDSFCRIDKGEVWMLGAHIEPYEFGTVSNHDSKRPRKLFLHARDIRKIDVAINTGGKSLIPIRMYFKEALVKVEVAICTGKKLFDKRDDLKKKVQMREANRAIRSRRP